MRSLLLLSLCFLILTSSCKKEDANGHSIALGGKIINPTAKSIQLFFDGQFIDSAFISKKNTFKFNIAPQKEGLYEYKHDQESQIVYLEKGDSVLLRVNTIGFDESLSYTGKGSEKNNLLTSLFLQNDKLDQFILDHINLKVPEFLNKANTLFEQSRRTLNKRNTKHNFSTEFNTLATKIIEINQSDLKERYFFTLNKHYPNKLNELPDDYFSYRNSINFSDRDLEFTYSYLRFINNYLNNRFLAYCTENNLNNCFNNYTEESVSKRLKLLDSLTSLNLVKNSLYDRIGKQGVILSNDTITSRNTITLLDSLGYNKEGLTELGNLLIVQKIFYPNNNLGTTALVNSNKERFTLKEVLKRTSVIYSWNTDSFMRQRRTQNVIAQLRKDYPNIDFIGITTSYKNFTEDKNSIDPWIKTLEDNKYNKNFEYHIVTSPVLANLLKNFTNKVLIVDASGKIIVGSTGLLSEELTTQLDKLD